MRALREGLAGGIEMNQSPSKSALIAKADALFENLVTLPELQVLAAKWLRRPKVEKSTVYSWIQQGIPHKKIRGALYFPPDGAATWLQRS